MIDAYEHDDDQYTEQEELRDRQRQAFETLKREGKSLLSGKPYNPRVDVRATMERFK